MKKDYKIDLDIKDNKRPLLDFAIKNYSLKWLEEEKFEAVQLILEKTENDLNYELDWDHVHKIESEIVKRENQEKLKND